MSMELQDYTISELRDEIRRRVSSGDLELVWERLENLNMKFHCVSTMALEDEHIMTYKNENGRVGFYIITRKLSNGNFGKGHYRFFLDNKEYANSRKFLKALKKYRNNVVRFN